ncbi:peptidoglycan recognition protein family protein [Pedobacter mucosus]|uniref:peptidoglycan recognition protein family protein n=1 Tax=Pedobacter mucosus TaxID=2895286 RepID=UPI001EE4C628|nr:N-acetylmuramoyl-L-alanine amidase [Pedobacter mucosus]UKT65392.1 N-acetylmuramoyl-L-alanine amidase [Pedobacter mucosus]
MSYSLTWLPKVLLDAGLKVAECPGWANSGRAEMGSVEGVLLHHTATTINSGNMPSLNTIIHGRAGANALTGPLAQLGLGRDGTYYIIAEGRCNHAGPGIWKGISAGNSHFIGIEAENRGDGKEPWPIIQQDAYARGVAAILKHINKGAEYCAGHKEYRLPKGAKNDPNFDMDEFRDKVRQILNGDSPPKFIPKAEPMGLFRSTLRRGIANDSPLVKSMQQKLKIEIDGFFGIHTETSVRAFQREQGLVPDGIVGPKTWKLIDDATV